MQVEIKCTECGSTEYVKAGFDIKARKEIQRYRCKKCKKIFRVDDKTEDK